MVNLFRFSYERDFRCNEPRSCRTMKSLPCASRSLSLSQGIRIRVNVLWGWRRWPVVAPPWAVPAIPRPGICRPAPERSPAKPEAKAESKSKPEAKRETACWAMDEDGSHHRGSNHKSMGAAPDRAVPGGVDESGARHRMRVRGHGGVSRIVSRGC